MADTGSQDDIYNRLLSFFPPWFGDNPPILGGVLRGFAYALAYVYSLIAFAQLQTRIRTATGGWLDMISADFFGTGLPRRQGETDAAFLVRIVTNMFRERGTRQAVINVLTDLTGRAPLIIEPRRPLDTGVYGGPYLGYGVAGSYGSLLLPYQAFVTAYRPIGTGIPLIAGYGNSPAGYSTGSRAAYASLSMIQSAVTDADIYAAVDSVKVAGTIVWVAIKS